MQVTLICKPPCPPFPRQTPLHHATQFDLPPACPSSPAFGTGGTSASNALFSAENRDKGLSFQQLHGLLKFLRHLLLTQTTVDAVIGIQIFRPV